MRSGLNGLSYIDEGGTPGPVTINAISGRAAFLANSLTVVITNSLVTKNTVVTVEREPFVGAAPNYNAGTAPSDGSFTVYRSSGSQANASFRFYLQGGR